MIQFVTGEVTPKSAEAFVNNMPDEALEIHVDSKGGDLFAGLRIFNALQQHPHKVEIIVDGLAGSVASIIALSGDKPPAISKTGSFMIHNALVPKAAGNHNDLRIIANTLEQYSKIVASVYADKTKLSLDQAIELMNKEQTIGAADAITLGFASSLIEPLKAVAYINEIDMTLLETIKAKLKSAPIKNEEAPIVAPIAAEEETAPDGAAFNEEQLAQITEIVGAMIAEAMKGNTEEVGATIATVLNSIVSEGAAPVSANPLMVETPIASVDGVTAFHDKMKEIRTNSKHN